MDRCDADNIALGTYVVHTNNGPLLLCDHHARKHWSTLFMLRYPAGPLMERDRNVPAIPVA